MPIVLNARQKERVEQVTAELQKYLDVRFKQVQRINSKIASVWEDLTWQQLAQVRISLAGDKPFGPERFVVADLLMGDDVRKIRDLFSPTSQSSLQGEIVEQREEGRGTAGTLEIHDMRSLYKAIDPSVQSIVQLIQTFIWWDLEDAADRARFYDRKGAVKRLDESELTPEKMKDYQARMKTERNLTKDEIIAFELKAMKYAVDNCRSRRSGDSGYQMIIVRMNTQQSDPDMLIGALAQEIGLLKHIRSGKEVDDNMKQQFAKALNCQPGDATAEKIAPFLEKRIYEHKTMLSDAFLGNTAGKQENYKLLQLAELEKAYKETAKGREPENQSYTEVNTAPAAGGR